METWSSEGEIINRLVSESSLSAATESEMEPRKSTSSETYFSDWLKSSATIDCEVRSARVDNPTSGRTTLIVSLQQKVEGFQSRVMALEALQSRSVENIAPDIISTIVNLPQLGVLSIDENLLGYPYFEGLSRLFTSTEESAPDILPTTLNFSKHGALPTYPTMSDYQAVLEGFLRGSSQVGYVAEINEAIRVIYDSIPISIFVMVHTQWWHV
ncbi:hypothetical protein LguiA_032949 [Lonicera macranthoides]